MRPSRHSKQGSVLSGINHDRRFNIIAIIFTVRLIHTLDIPSNKLHAVTTRNAAHARCDAIAIPTRL